MSKYTEGQRLVIIDVNRGPSEGTVIKVGRTLVHVEPDQYPGHWWPFRMEDGTRNDSYGHQSILTAEEFAEQEERAALYRHMREAGFDRRLGHPEHPLPVLRRMVSALADPAGER